MSPEELGVRYFTGRLDFCHREGIPLTAELLSIHVHGAIAITASAARDTERERLALLADERCATYESVVPGPDGIPEVWVHPFADLIRKGGG